MAAPTALKRKCVAPSGTEIELAGLNAGMSIIMVPVARSIAAVKGAENVLAEYAETEMSDLAGNWRSVGTVELSEL